MSNETSYILGLWCADGYHRTSSIGLSNVNVKLIQRFTEFLLERFDESRLRLRVYIPKSFKENFSLDDLKVKKVSILQVTKAKQPSYHIYVNSRPFLREFREQRKLLLQMSNDGIFAYLAGRFDGDGSIHSDGRTDFRIVYGNLEEAAVDRELLKRVRSEYQVKVYEYKQARTHCLYVSRYDAPNLITDLMPYSTILKEKFLTP